MGSLRAAVGACALLGVALLGCHDAANADRPSGAPPPTPRVIAPTAGAATGSARIEGALRPRFAWERVVDATRPISYDVELDDDCVPGAIDAARFLEPTVRATGLVETTWRPPRDLVVAADAPMGRRFCWHVRACHGGTCSPWSRTRVVDVGRAAGDVDGDGYSDLVIGAPLVDNGGRDRGSAFVYGGGADGLGPPLRLDEPEDLDGAAFGVAVALADLDGDRFDDVVVGAAGSDDARGAVYVYFGGAAGISPSRRLRLAEGDVPDDWFGATVAGLGDVDGDGLDDLAVGASGADGEGVDWGIVRVFYGARDLATASAADLADPYRAARPPVRLAAPAARHYDGFGASLAGGGDVDGDGYADLAVGAPGVDTAGDRRGTERGAVYVFRGSSDGLGAFPLARLEAPIPLDHDRFGHAVALAGDLDGDGRGELLVGAPSTDGPGTDSGLVYLYRGGDAGPDRLPSALVGEGEGGSDDDGGGAAPGTTALGGERFGTAVAAAGDVDADGFVDFTVGTGGGGDGRALLYRGGREQLGHAPAVALDEHTPLSGTPDKTPRGRLRDFGEAVTGIGDIDADGFADLAVAASGADNGGTFRGSVLVFRGGPAGFGVPLRLDDPDHGEHDQFGHTIATSRR